MATYQNEMYGEHRVPDVLAPSRGLGIRDADVVSAAGGASGAGGHSVGWCISRGYPQRDEKLHRFYEERATWRWIGEVVEEKGVATMALSRRSL
jgi:hypothetical protein